MENKSISTFEEYVIDQFGKIPEDSNDMIDLGHEYAVLFAKHHREKAIEEIKGRVEQSCVDMNLFTELDIIINSIENACSEDEIK